ncbi:MAG: hypothetical protein ACMXX9_02815 [Candidatus Woesearchaeota archaeon]
MSKEQAINIVTRYNLLEEEQEKLSKDIINRDNSLFFLRKDITKEINHIKKEIEKLESMVSELQLLKDQAISSFKHIVKKENFNTTKAKIDNFKYEELLSRSELYRLK